MYITRCIYVIYNGIKYHLVFTTCFPISNVAAVTVEFSRTRRACAES